MDIKCCLLFLSLLFAGAAARPEPATPTTWPPCTPWCAGQPTPPPGAVN